MRMYLLFLIALWDNLDRVQELLGTQWTDTRSKLFQLLLNLLREGNSAAFPGRVNQIYRSFNGTAAESLVHDLFQQATRKSQANVRYKSGYAILPDRGGGPFPDIELGSVIDSGPERATEDLLAYAETLAESIAPSVVETDVGGLPLPVPEKEKHINAWISERTTDPRQPLELSKRYTLNLGVGAPITTSLIESDGAKIPAADLRGGGLQTEWVIRTSDFELSSADAKVELPAILLTPPKRWEAKFPLWIPEDGESEVRRLFITPLVSRTSRLELLIYAVKESRAELYRKLSIEVPVGAAVASVDKVTSSLIRDDLIHAPSAQLNLRTTHEWTTPPGRLGLTVLPGTREAHVKGELPGGKLVDEFVDWDAQQANLKGPIENARDAAEKFRGKWEQYLNDIDPQDLLQRLAQFKPTYDWWSWQSRADQKHVENWDKARKSQELRDLAICGRDLYETVFPPFSPLRAWVDSLPPGHRLDISWTESSGPGYVPNVPWGLMYLSELPAPDSPVDPMGFLALRFRIGYRGYKGVPAASKDLGAMASAYQAYCLYWGNHPSDQTGNESDWQRQTFASWENQIFAPQDPASPGARAEVLQALSEPLKSPTSVIYFFCQAANGAGNKPVLRFGPTSGSTDVLQTTDLLSGKLLHDQPLVFANACSTSAADPYVANLLEKNFFRRGCRGFLGTETKVPIQLASRFATIFFYFFYRRIDPAPMAAGEALAQTRLFLLTEYANIGGIFYTYLNQYELYMASAAEIEVLRI